jgi:hypothetical protein
LGKSETTLHIPPIDDDELPNAGVDAPKAGTVLPKAGDDESNNPKTNK